MKLKRDTNIHVCILNLNNFRRFPCNYLAHVSWFLNLWYLKIEIMTKFEKERFFFPFQIRCSTFYIVVAQLLHTTNYIHVTLLKSKIRKRICLIHQFDALFLKNPQMQSITMFASCMQFRLSLILLIFKSLQSHNIWGIWHIIYFYSFSLEAL